MSMHDLFGINVLHVLAADADDAEEAEQFRAVISQVERVMQQNMEMKWHHET